VCVVNIVSLRIVVFMLEWLDAGMNMHSAKCVKQIAALMNNKSC